MGAQNQPHEAPRGDKERHRCTQEPPKSSQKEPERGLKRLQNHFWVENADASNILILLNENHHFRKRAGQFGSSKSTPRGSERR